MIYGMADVSEVRTQFPLPLPFHEFKPISFFQALLTHCQTVLNSHEFTYERRARDYLWPQTPQKYTREQYSRLAVVSVYL